MLKFEEEHERAKLWGQLSGFPHSKKLLEGYKRERSNEFLKLSKRSLGSLTGFLSGHCRLRGHLKRIGVGKHGDCRFFGDEKETPEHLLCECETVLNTRTNLFGSSISSLNQTQQLVFIKALKLEEEL